VTSLKLCLAGDRSRATSLEEDIRIASEAGFTCIDLWSPKLDEYLATYPTVWLDIKMREHHVYPVAVSGVELALPATREQDLLKQAHLLELCTRLDALGGGTIVIHPRVQPWDEDPTAETEPAQTVPRLVRALRAYSGLAAPFDVHLALEFRADARGTTRTLAASQEIVRKVSRSNVGLSLNTLGLYESEVRPEELNTLDVGRLKLVHLERAPSVKRSSHPTSAPAGRGKTEMWATPSPALDRMPGVTESPLQAICEHLATQGFRGPYCITYPTKQEAAKLALGSQTLPQERARWAKQVALDLLTPLYL
jgi:sugar phosphate isomerase/epimerase